MKVWVVLGTVGGGQFLVGVAASEWLAEQIAIDDVRKSFGGRTRPGERIVGATFTVQPDVADTHLLTVKRGEHTVSEYRLKPVEVVESLPF